MTLFNAQLQDSLRVNVRLYVRAGYESEKEIFFRISNEVAKTISFDIEYGKILTRLLREEVQMHRQMEREWDGVTDCDNLDEAFAALDRVGVISRQYWGDGQRDGFERIQPLYTDSTVGCCFFHERDVEHALRRDELYLAYQAANQDEKDSVHIGHIICNVLRQHDLIPEWPGILQKRIALRPFMWRRRRWVWGKI